MDRPKANANTITTTNGLSPATVMSPSCLARNPCSNTALITPNVAPRETTFITTALSGTTREPVIANSSTTMASTVTPTAKGSRSPSSPSRSLRKAASPVTQDWPPPGRSARARSTSARAVAPSGSPATSIFTTDRPGPTCSAGADQGRPGQQRGDQRPALHHPGQPGEEADLGRVAEAGDPPGRPLRRLDPAPGQADHGRGEGQRHQHRDQRDGDTGGAQRGQAG